MKVELSDETMAVVNRLIAQGRCSTVDEAVRLGINVLHGDATKLERFFDRVEADPTWMAEIQRKLDEGAADIEAGRLVPGDVAIAKARELVRAKQAGEARAS